MKINEYICLYFDNFFLPKTGYPKLKLGVQNGQKRSENAQNDPDNVRNAQNQVI